MIQKPDTAKATLHTNGLAVTVYSSIDECNVRLRQLNEKLRPIAERPIVPTMQGFLERQESLRKCHPLDQVGGRAEAESLLASLTEFYVSSPDLREPIRNMFERYRSVRWALWPQQQSTTEEGFRSRLLGISMRDVHEDPRDALSELERNCQTAEAAGMDIRPIIESVAAISSEPIGRMMRTRGYVPFHTMSR
jgi:hypothetical protein